MLRKIAIVTCLACAVVAGVFCGVTYRHEISWQVQNPEKYQHTFAFTDGKFGCRWAADYPAVLPTEEDAWEIRLAGLLLAYSGAYVPPEYIDLHGPAYYVVVPLWLPIVLFSAYPVVALVAWPLRQRRRRRNRLCLHCGYDLTGNIRGRCPECGALIDRQFAK